MTDLPNPAHAPDAAWQQWFESIWTLREETLYPQFFGHLDAGMFPLQAATFARYGVKEVDGRFLTHGVLVSPPNEKHATWLYVSSGMSNAWGAAPDTVNPADYSGLGFELVMETPEQSPWAVGVLHWLMVVQLLVATAQVQGELIAFHDRVPLGGPLDGRESPLNALILCEPAGYPGRFALPSGQVDLMLCVGITERERQFAAAQGSDGLVNLLKHHHVFPLTDPRRPSVV